MNFGLGILAEKRKADLSRKVIDLIAKETEKPYRQIIIKSLPRIG